MRDSDLFTYRDGNLYWATGKRAGTNHHGYMAIKSRRFIGPPLQMVHRLIWEIHHGPIPDGYVIDHINRVPLDNRIENLRLATRSQNSMNAKGKSHATLPRNVYVDWTYKGTVKYRAQVTARGMRLRVGNLDTVDEAVKAAAALREKLHGNFQFVKDGPC